MPWVLSKSCCWLMWGQYLLAAQLASRIYCPQSVSISGPLFLFFVFGCQHYACEQGMPACHRQSARREHTLPVSS